MLKQKQNDFKQLRISCLINLVIKDGRRTFVPSLLFVQCSYGGVFLRRIGYGGVFPTSARCLKRVSAETWLRHPGGGVLHYKFIRGCAPQGFLL